MILLNPGPVNVSERVRQALLRPDICHRESEFSDMLQRIQQKLLTAFAADNPYSADDEAMRAAAGWRCRSPRAAGTAQGKSR